MYEWGKTLKCVPLTEMDDHSYEKRRLSRFIWISHQFGFYFIFVVLLWSQVHGSLGPRPTRVCRVCSILFFNCHLVELGFQLNIFLSDKRASSVWVSTYDSKGCLRELEVFFIACILWPFSYRIERYYKA